jgi:O-antigen/teichoic acid export membrane protein
MIMVSTDLWILSWARSHEEVAVYGVVTRIIQVMGALPAIASFILPQEIAVLHADGRHAELERLARTAATAVALLSLGALLGIVVLGRPLIRLAFGEGYVSGWGLLLILAVGTFWDAASGLAGYVLQMTGHHVRLLRLTAASAATNAALNLFLAPRFGGYGVAAATALTLIGFNLLVVRAARQAVGVRTFVYWDPAEWRRILWLVLTGGIRETA